MKTASLTGFFAYVIGIAVGVCVAYLIVTP